MSKRQKQYAVFTGDIIKSTKLASGDLAKVRTRVMRAARSIGTWKKDLVTGKPEFFRGDAWQMLVTDPVYSFRIAVWLRAYLRSMSFDSRVAVGIGPVKKVHREKISLSSGPAFVCSGHALDDMPPGHHMAMSVDGEENEVLRLSSVLLRMCSALVDNLSPRQAELVTHALHPDGPTHERIARKVKPRVDRRVVSKTLDRASFHVLEEAVAAFESTDLTVLRAGG